MFSFIRQLFGWFTPPKQSLQDNRESDQGVKSFETLNLRVPLATATGAKNAFVRREAILNRDQKIAGYQFSLLPNLRLKRKEDHRIARLPYDEILLDRLGFYDISALLGHRFALVDLSPMSLNSPLIRRLQANRTWLTLQLSKDETNLEQFLAPIERAQSEGFSVGIRIRTGVLSNAEVIAAFDHIQVDVSDFDGLDLRSTMHKLKTRVRAKKTPTQFIASDVRSHDDFLFCMKCGFDLFQGAFVSSRESLTPTSNTINQLVLLEVLRMVRSDEPFGAVAERLRMEPTMTYRLLRYFNSAAFRFPERISNLTEALVLLGRDKFYRWTSLLLFDIKHASYPERMLAEQALSRARTLELLAGKGSIPRDSDNLFLTGLFSLLDRVLGRPLPELADKAALPYEVRDALLRNTGLYANALILVVDAEIDTTTCPEHIIEVLRNCGISYSEYFLAATSGHAWAGQVIESSS
jgi:EAL and modified HD-GYP domain-containing signal transduction protein